MEKLQKLRDIRTQRNLTRVELSKISGVNQTTIQRLEEGFYNVNCVKLNTLINLAKALHCKVIDFIDKDLQRYIA